MPPSVEQGLNANDTGAPRFAVAPDDLLAIVWGFWQIVRSPEEEARRGIATTHLPTPTFEIVCLAEGTVVSGGSRRIAPTAFVAAPRLHPTPFGATGNVVLWGARLAPHVLAALGYCDARTARTYPLLAPLLDEEGAALLADALAARTFEVRCLALARLLRAGSRISRGRPASAAEIDRLGEALPATSAAVRARQRAHARWVGLSPTELSVLARFDQALRELFERPMGAGDLADLAQAVGYADQAHLTRHFRRFLGDSPAAFRKRVHAYLGGLRSARRR